MNYSIRLHSEKDGTTTKIEITHYEMSDKVLKLFNEEELVFMCIRNNGEPALFFNREDPR